MREVFKECVNGLEDIIGGDIRPKSIIMVTGGPGTLKSGFVHNFLSNYLCEHPGEFGVYATLEEMKKSHLANMESLGIEKPENLRIFDFGDMRREWREEESELSIAEITEDIIEYYVEEKGESFTVFALDSLNALNSLETSENARRSSYHLFTRLRDYGLTSFITAEIEAQSGYSLDYFLTDVVIEVGIAEKSGKIRRYLQLRKLRASDHSMEKRQLTVEDEGISIGGALYE